jgi:hypothetical protein
VETNKENQTGQALVIPADMQQPVRVIEYSRPDELLEVLYREIGCDYVDATPELPSRAGCFVLWLDDVGLLKRPIEHNDRAIALCRAIGYNVADLAGTAVVTGGTDGAGNTRTIPSALRDQLLATFHQPRVESDRSESPTPHQRRSPSRAGSSRGAAARRDAGHNSPHDSARWPAPGADPGPTLV